MEGFHASSYFQVLQSLYQSFGDSTKSINYIWFKVTFILHRFFFNSLATSFFFFRFLKILLCDQPDQQSSQFGKFFGVLWLLLGLAFWPIWGDSFLSQNPWGVCASRSPGYIQACVYTLCSYGQIYISYIIISRLPCPQSCF